MPNAANHAPSVGFMQPWRFIRITDRSLREAMHAPVEVERKATARALGEREEDFMRLKVEGLLDGEAVVLRDGMRSPEHQKHFSASPRLCVQLPITIHRSPYLYQRRSALSALSAFQPAFHPPRLRSFAHPRPGGEMVYTRDLKSLGP